MRVTLNEEWREVASVTLPDSLSSLSDDDLEQLGQHIERECTDVFLALMDN